VSNGQVRDGKLGIMLVLAAILGALIFALGQWAVEKVWEPTTVQGESGGTTEAEASLLDALHEAAEEAVTVDDGKYSGEWFKVTRIEFTAGNPHVTAYRVVVEPKG
jgi:hypothetical protein